MRSLRRFASWLKSVYGSIKQFIARLPEEQRPQINDDIRRVMDRMLATDEQIQQANEVAGLMPDETADAQAAERLNKRSMADLKWAVKARDAVIAKLKKQARTIEKGTRAEVTAQVDATPEMMAKAKLAELEAEHEADPVAADMNTAAVADAFGFPSVDAMYRAIDAFGNRADVIDGLTQKRMLEEHGDLIDERAIKEAANEAVHNDARARSLATELRTQREMAAAQLVRRARSVHINTSANAVELWTLDAPEAVSSSVAITIARYSSAPPSLKPPYSAGTERPNAPSSAMWRSGCARSPWPGPRFWSAV